MNRVFVPLVAILCFIAENLFVTLIPYDIALDNWIFVPRFIFLFLLFITIFYDKKTGVLYAFIFGLLQDVIYAEIFGIYLFWYPFTIYLVYLLMKVLQSNIFMVSLVCILSVSFLEFGIYEIYMLIRETTMNVKQFVSLRLMPTVILNVVVFLLLFYPVKKRLEYYNKIRRDEEGMFQS